jgi:hypothetical protein
MDWFIDLLQHIARISGVALAASDYAFVMWASNLNVLTGIPM